MNGPGKNNRQEAARFLELARQLAKNSTDPTQDRAQEAQPTLQVSEQAAVHGFLRVLDASSLGDARSRAISSQTSVDDVRTVLTRWWTAHPEVPADTADGQDDLVEDEAAGEAISQTAGTRSLLQAKNPNKECVLQVAVQDPSARVAEGLLPELKTLRKGRGVYAVTTTGTASRVGPALRALCQVVDEDAPEVIRRKVETWLVKLAERLPESSRQAVLVAFGVLEEARLPLYQARIAWVAERQQQTMRTVRRRVDDAVRQLAELAELDGAREAIEKPPVSTGMSRSAPRAGQLMIVTSGLGAIGDATVEDVPRQQTAAQALLLDEDRVRSTDVPREGLQGLEWHTDAHSLSVDLGTSRELSGMVRHRDGSGVEHAVLTLIDRAGEPVARVVAGRDGAYRITAPADGSYVLIAGAVGHRPQASSLVLGGGAVSADVTLIGSGEVAGTVRDRAGTPVARATITLADTSGEVVGSGTSASDGSFRLTGVGAGPHTLVVDAPHTKPYAAQLTVPESGVVRHDVDMRNAHDDDALPGVGRMGRRTRHRTRRRT